MTSLSVPFQVEVEGLGGVLPPTKVWMCNTHVDTIAGRGCGFRGGTGASTPSKAEGNRHLYCMGGTGASKGVDPAPQPRKSHPAPRLALCEPFSVSKQDQHIRKETSKGRGGAYCLSR